MIADFIENASLYSSLGEYFGKAFEFLRVNDLNALEDGRHEIDGNNAYVNVFTTVLHKRTADRYEVHKLYADIQIPLNGTDMIAVCPLDETGEREEYNEAGDTFFVNGGEPSIVSVRPGTMLILMPQDAHDPGLTKTEAGKKIRKAVIKVRV